MFVVGAGGVWLQPTNGAAALFCGRFSGSMKVDGEAVSGFWRFVFLKPQCCLHNGATPLWV